MSNSTLKSRFYKNLLFLTDTVRLGVDRLIHLKNFLDYVGIKEEDIYLIIKNWNPNKTHGSDENFIRICKLCGKTTVFSMKLLFQLPLGKGIFPDDWKEVI